MATAAQTSSSHQCLTLPTTPITVSHGVFSPSMRPTPHSVPEATPEASPNGLNSLPTSPLNAVGKRKPPERRMYTRCLAVPKPTVACTGRGTHTYGNATAAAATPAPWIRRRRVSLGRRLFDVVIIISSLMI